MTSVPLDLGFWKNYHFFDVCVLFLCLTRVTEKLTFVVLCLSQFLMSWGVLWQVS